MYVCDLTNKMIFKIQSWFLVLFLDIVISCIKLYQIIKMHVD